MSRIARLAVAFLALAGAASVAEQASARDRTPSVCEDGGILSRIQSKFRHQVAYVPNLPRVGIVEFTRVHERRYLPFAEHQPIARRYCGATALLSDGRQRPVWYLIEDGMGFAGIGDNVEFCVSGFDRWLVYNGRCRIVR